MKLHTYEFSLLFQLTALFLWKKKLLQNAKITQKFNSLDIYIKKTSI